MKISKKLPQFEGEKVLILVSGNNRAEFYLISDNHINMVDDLRIKDEHYSDKEGFFVRSGLGRIFKTGAVREPVDKDIMSEFIRKVTENIKKFLYFDEVDRMYIFGPEYLKNFLKDAVPKSYKKKLIHFFSGNLTNHHPFELLKKIAELE